MNWKQGKPVERAVSCCGCGGTYAVAECSVAKVGTTHVFACSPECEREYEDSVQAAATLEEMEAARGEVSPAYDDETPL